MKPVLTVFLLLLILTMTDCKHQITLKYPAARMADSVDNYFGVKVPDPYRWLENDTSAETAAWVKAENQLTGDYLANIPFREKIREQLTKMWNFPRVDVPFREGDLYFFFKNDGLQNQSVFFCTHGISGKPVVLLDPNKLSPDGTIALETVKVSHDGKYLAYSLARSGSDWNTIRIMEIATGKTLDESVEWVKFSDIAWQGDGFYYSRYDKPGKGAELTGQNKNHKVCFHQVGTSQDHDKLIFSNASFPLRNYSAMTTEDERFLIVYESEAATGNALFAKDLSVPGMPFRQLVKEFDHIFNVVDNLGGQLLVQTNFGASRQKLVLMDPADPAPENWKTIIPEGKDVLESVHPAGNLLVAKYMHDASSRIFLFGNDGNSKGEIALPGIGTISAVSSKKGGNDLFYGYVSFTVPHTIFRYELREQRSSVYFRPQVDFYPDQYEVKQVFYQSKDKTSIPMFIVMKKGTELNGKNPLLLYGYGGFNISLTPNFSVSRLVFLEHGGIYAVPNLRGGGEYGEEWHLAGTKAHKQNVFDDFIAAGEYLIREKYTSSASLAIMGGSNGGLLVGACMTQRPELFKVAIPQVGVMDMLRYHKFTIGWAWAGDYGTSESKEGFENLIKYSPLHNIKSGVQYPVTLALTADHDDRVVPAHTFKFMATLQSKQAGTNPVLVRIDSKAGHGAGKPTTKLIDETTDIWSFVFYNLGMAY